MATTSDTKLVDLSGLKVAIDLIFTAFTTRTAKHIKSIEKTADDSLVFKCVDGSTAYTLTSTPAYTHPTQTALTGVPTANQSPGFGGTFTVSQPTVNTLGHTTSLTSRTITIPSSTASTTSAGLMSKDDKVKLDGIAAGAQVNTLTGVKGNSESAYRTGNVNLTAANVGAAASTHSHTAATTSADGFMSKSDKTKLDGIAASANNYTHPTQSALTGVPTANQSPAFGGTFTVSQPTVNTLGHTTSLTSRTITIPSLPTASSSTAGVIKIGSGLAMSNGVLSVDMSELILPSTASTKDRAIWIAEV